MYRLIALLFAGLLFTAPFTVAGEEPIPFEAYTLADQHGTPHRLQPETRTVIMSFEMKKAKAMHAWLAAQEPDFLKKYRTEYVVDITPMPGIITFLFAGPKMKKYKFPIIQADSKDFARTYPHQEGKLTVFSLSDDQKTATVQYVTGPEEVEALQEP